MTEADQAVVRSILDGDHNAFASLVARYQQRLFGLALMMVRDLGIAEEVTQDAFVRAFERLDRFDQSRPLHPWLAAITVRVAQNRMRSGRKERRQMPIESVGEPGTESSALADLIADEQGLHVWRAVAPLPSGERTAALLYYRDGLLVRDVAMALGVSPGTVKTLLFRARQHLRARLTMYRGVDAEA